MGRVKNILSRRFLLYAILILIQIAYFILFEFYLQDNIPYFGYGLRVIGFLFILHILYMPMNPEYKIAWIIPILAFPLIGVPTYMVLKRKRFGNKHRNAYQNAFQRTVGKLQQNEEVLAQIKEPLTRRNAERIFNQGQFPVCLAETVKYFPSGEAYVDELLLRLHSAKKYVFLEYFIIDKGWVWGNILEILKEKVKNGVEVYVLYDDIGCVKTMHAKDLKEIRSFGIKIYTFNQFKPLLNIQLNNRSHKKTAIIDGEWAFCGGVNLSDEYVNRYERFGKWKDCGIEFNGAGVDNFTLSFLQLLTAYEKVEDFDKYLFSSTVPTKSDNIIIPFVDIPQDNVNTTEDTFLQLIYSAKKSLYIFTPYLIIDNELSVALVSAKSSGVDVRIVVPHIPDKKMVFEVTQYYYTSLLRSGIRVYEYTPGFIHSKVVLCDGKQAYVGSCNLDYRSMYLHLENGVFVDSVQVCSDIEQDFANTFEESEEKTVQSTKVSVLRKVYRSLLRLFAPLL